ncbi:hypothetical protein LIA77_04641 [Sarocladium implicatum]|nr:hypothetical protein LIA77_04641 [Sarocladium implicatum]
MTAVLSATESLDKGPKACTTCAKAKARCIRLPGCDARCQRCSRLDKTCLSQEPAPPRPRNPAKRSRVAQLEERLEELTSQLDSGVDGRPSGLPVPASPFASLFTANLLGKRKRQDTQESTSSSAEATDESPPPESSWDILWPTSEEATGLLALYKKTYAPLFPFVVLPDGVSEAEMRVKHPNVWKAIMMMGCYMDGPRHTRMGEDMLEGIGRICYAEGNTTLDLLQGLLLFITWYYCTLSGQKLIHLLFLTRSACLNLGLGGAAMRDPAQKTLEELRAYVGTYYVNTVVVATNNRSDTLMMSTRLLGSCCKAIRQAMEYPSDELLCYLVEGQQLSHSIIVAMMDPPLEHVPKTPLIDRVRSLQHQIDSFQDSLPPQMRAIPLMQSQVHLAAALVAEVAVADERCTAEGISPSDRLDLLQTCAKHLRAWFDLRLPSPPQGMRFPPLCASDVGFTMILCMRLLSIHDMPGWNTSKVMNEVRLSQALGNLESELAFVKEKRAAGSLYARDALREKQDISAKWHKVQGIVKRMVMRYLEVPVEEADPKAFWSELMSSGLSFDAEIM